MEVRVLVTKLNWDSAWAMEVSHPSGEATAGRDQSQDLFGANLEFENCEEEGLPLRKTLVFGRPQSSRRGEETNKR